MNPDNAVDAYIESFPDNVRVKLKQIRHIIKQTAPNMIETISYGIPTFKLNGKNVVHFGGFKNHIGFFPTPSGIEAFKDELSPYQKGRGTLQFSLDQPLPENLITRIVQFRVKENEKNNYLPSKMESLR